MFETSSLAMPFGMMVEVSNAKVSDAHLGRAAGA